MKHPGEDVSLVYEDKSRRAFDFCDVVDSFRRLSALFTQQQNALV